MASRRLAGLLQRLRSLSAGLPAEDVQAIKTLLLASANGPDPRVAAALGDGLLLANGEEDDEQRDADAIETLRCILQSEQRDGSNDHRESSQLYHRHHHNAVALPPPPSASPSRALTKTPQSQSGLDPRVTLVFAARDMQDVAAHAVEVSNGALELGSIVWNRFDVPDGWPNLFIEDAHNVQFRDIMFLASFDTPQVVFEQISVVYTLARLGARSLRVVVPFFATGTMERIEREGEVATAAVLARMLSMIPLSAGGPSHLIFLDIHALQERFYFTDNVIVHLKSCMRLLLEEVALMHSEDRIVIVFPDDGAYKRFHVRFENTFPLVVCHKIRTGDARVVQVRDGLEFVEGAHCIIVDDLVKSGGTLIECGVVLQKARAHKISAFVTHGVFPGDSWRKFLRSNTDAKVQFERFWFTDSIPPSAKAVEGLEPFKVLSIAPLIPYVQQNYWENIPGRYD